MSAAPAESRRIGIIGAVVVAGAFGAVLAAPSPASASASASAQTTFSGHCSVTRTDHDLRESFFRGQGVCVGSLNGERAAAHHVTVIASHPGVAGQSAMKLVFGPSKCTQLDPCRIMQVAAPSSMQHFSI